MEIRKEDYIDVSLTKKALAMGNKIIDEFRQPESLSLHEDFISWAPHKYKYFIKNYIADVNSKPYFLINLEETATDEKIFLDCSQLIVFDILSLCSIYFEYFFTKVVYSEKVLQKTKRFFDQEISFYKHLILFLREISFYSDISLYLNKIFPSRTKRGCVCIQYAIDNLLTILNFKNGCFAIMTCSDNP